MFRGRDSKGACAHSSPRASRLHSICISASLHNATKHTENKREHRGGERKDRPNNKLNHKRESLTCVCVYCVCVRVCIEQGDRKPEEDGGDKDKCREGERQRAAEERKTEGEIKFART